MTLMNLIGLLSLISLIILLIIYILKPNYQQQFISSTYIWKLSLKYRKRRLPTSKLRNILLIICQVLLLLTLTAIIVRPVNITKETVENEAIIVVDASASMRTQYEGKTRFERAIDLVKEKANETFDKEGAVTVVISDNNPHFLVERGTVNSKDDIQSNLDNLKSDFYSCSYGETSLSDSISLCHDILIDNPNAHIYIYTDTTVSYTDDTIEVINVCTEGENNFAVLDAYAEIVDNYYSFVVEVAGYGRDENVVMTLSVYGANATDVDPDGINLTFSLDVDLVSDKPKRVVFINEYPETFNEEENTEFYIISELERIFSYESAHVEIDIEDCFNEDNFVEIYGGTKEDIKVVYCSNKSNSFFNGIMFVLRDALKNKYHIDYTEVKDGDVPYRGYDFYIYEHEMMPDVTPNDGIVLYADPQKDTESTGFRVYGYYDLDKVSVSFTQESEHPLLDGVVVDNITASRYTELSQFDRNYEVLATLNGRPVLMVKNEENYKIVVMLFSLHYSNLALLKEFPILFTNIFQYFLPSTIEGNSFEVNDEVKVNSRSQEITITGYDETIRIDEFPSTVSLKLPGSYTIEQTTYFGKNITEKIYAKVPKDESNIFPVLDSLSSPISAVDEYDYINDWLFYLAIALCALSFIEWLLKGNESA